MVEDDSLQTIRMLRGALSGIWTALEYASPETMDEAIEETMTMADEGLSLSLAYCKAGKDLTDDTIGLESWRRHVSPDGTIIKRF